MQVRSLLALLVQMDAGRHFDESVRLQINTDITSFSHVSPTEMEGFFSYWSVGLGSWY